MNELIEKAYKIVHSLMLENDAFSKWLGIQVSDIALGHCILHTEIRSDMVNGFGICHGGITYSIADSALAFASNTHGIKSVSIETSISHIIQIKVGDKITATAKEKSLINKLGIYEVELTNQNNDLVALFKGTVYRTGKAWEV